MKDRKEERKAFEERKRKRRRRRRRKRRRRGWRKRRNFKGKEMEADLAYFRKILRNV